MADFLTFLLLALATYGISCMVAKEEGPFSIFTWLRGIDANEKTWIGRGVRCPFCLSVWIGSLLCLLWSFGVFDYRLPFAFLMAFAISGLVLGLLRLLGQR